MPWHFVAYSWENKCKTQPSKQETLGISEHWRKHRSTSIQSNGSYAQRKAGKQGVKKWSGKVPGRSQRSIRELVAGHVQESLFWLKH